jgi:hypothetical protein
MTRAFSLFPALCSAVAAAVLGFAGPAGADGDQPAIPEGVYTYHQDGLPPAEWTVYPICAPTVGDLRVNLELPVGCTVHVASNDLSVAGSGDARLTSGLWTFTVPQPQGFTCPDGRTMRSQEVYSFDLASMTGTRTASHNTECGVDASLTKTPFTVSYTGPLPIPVDKYPIYCSPYDALRRCS